jgi:outer membrane protein assembly factor BamE (lipoprotein component of BamABCDE complex)
MLSQLPRVRQQTSRKISLGGIVTLGYLAIGAGMMSGCGNRVTHHGHYILPADLAKCQPRVSTKEKVAHILGTPTVINAYDPDTWYYLSQSSQHLPTKKSTMIKRLCYAMEFSSQGVLQSITASSPLVDFVPHSDQTPLPSKYKESNLAQILNSVKKGDFVVLPQ